ncbi:MAG: 2OG-Fe(II) oxygenase [Proteobacteria bacterium]|nr:2OG-Fe(II) oxygenase [Pseudomonadota bacterium]
MSMLEELDWPAIVSEIDRDGFATAGPVLSPADCASVVGLYDQNTGFRSRVVMARHGFGAGEYKYFDYPLPDPVHRLRQEVYPRLAPLANQWAAALRLEHRYPETLDGFTRRCHDAGQTKPTPLLLRYGVGDYNRLHRDLYGPLVFPIQMAILLTDPKEFEGGAFMLVENRPRMQARAEVIDLRQGEAVLFAVDQRPVQGTRGTSRASMRHGVSRLRAGSRHTLGVIFHDAI